MLLYLSGFAAASFASLLFLGRPYVKLEGEMLTVRNPIYIHAIPRAEIVGVKAGGFGFGSLVTRGGDIRVMGLEETAMESVRGGSEDQAILNRWIKTGLTGFRQIDDNSPTYRKTPTQTSRLAPFDWPLALLLVGWILHLIRFLSF